MLLATSLPETRPAKDRVNSSVGSAVAAYGVLLRDRHFLGLVFIGAFGISSFFAYLANSSFVLIDHYGLTPRQYSLAFAANAASFIGISQFTGKLSARFGLVKLVKFAVVGYALMMSLLLAVNLSGIERLDVMLGMLFVGYGFLGLVVPTTAVLALDEHGEIAGTASALMGTLQFVTGAVVMGITGALADGTARPMVAGIAGSAIVALLLTRITLRKTSRSGGLNPLSSDTRFRRSDPMTDIVVQQPAGAAKQLFLLHHGVGATPQGLLPLGRRLAAEFPEALVVSVQGPEASDLGQGYQWFSVIGITEETRPERVAAAMPAFVKAVQGLASPRWRQP